MASPLYPHAVFDALRPYCVQLTMQQTVQNVRALRSQIATMETSALQNLLDYVMFPLRFALKTPESKNPNLLQTVLECISYLLSRTSVCCEVALLEMFNEFCSCIPTNQNKPVPEELKLAVVCALRFLLNSASSDIFPVLHKPAFLPEMGFTITLLLKFAEHESSRELRLDSLGCLDDLLLQHNQGDPTLGDLFASFLPGICTSLARIICGDPKQGYRIVTNSLKIWVNMVVLVLSDESLARYERGKSPFPEVKGRLAELLVEKDEFWVDDTTDRLSTHLDCIAERCITDPHWKVRLAMVNLSYSLLTRCWKAMESFSGKLLKIVVAHISDERPEVKARAKDVLMEVVKEGPVCRALGDMLSESLHSLTVSLPRVLSSQDDEEKLHSLGLLLGYLQLLGPQLTITLRSQAHLQRLSNALLQTLELDLSSVKLVEERLSSTVPLAYQDPAFAGAPRKTFRFFRDHSVLSLILSICRLLGYHGDLCLLIDHFLGFYRAHRLPSILILNQLILGAAGQEVETLNGSSRTIDMVELRDVVRLLLEEYTDPANWDLYTCQGSGDELDDRMASLNIGSSKKQTIHDVSANAWKLCLQLEGISHCAKAMGQSFRPFLISTLYPVLEKAGDPSMMVSRVAMLTLSDISVACKYQGVIQLIESNADYLASEVSVGLRRLCMRNAGAARVLHSMLANCGSSLLPILGELVQDLLPALDQTQGDGARIIFPVLNLLVAHLGKWFPPGDTQIVPKLPEVSVWNPEDSESLAQEIQDFLQNHIEQQRLARGEVEEEEVETIDAPLPQKCDDEDDQKPEMPTHIRISKEVAERCSHFLSHKNPQIRLQALDTLLLSLVSLQSQEDVLLPLAHKVWPSLVKRLLHDEPLVLIRAFKVLVSLAASCKDFLRQRVCKDALPAFLTSLRSQAPASCRAGPVYSHTMAFKLQLAVLEGLGSLCVTLGLGDGDLLEVLDSCVLYLSARQPKRLQEAATRVFHNVALLDPDITWLYLCEWQSPPPVPHSSLTPLPWTGKSNDEYTQNVHKILKKLL
ncbi:TELO2-interacting protein 1 homolog [Discoglossus pictus]